MTVYYKKFLGFQSPFIRAIKFKRPRKKSCSKEQDFFSMISVSLSERVIYLRYDIHLRWMIYASHMKERILYHICRANISYGLPYIISHSDISFNLAPPPLLCYACATIGIKNLARSGLLWQGFYFRYF